MAVGHRVESAAVTANTFSVIRSSSWGPTETFERVVNLQDISFTGVFFSNLTPKKYAHQFYFIVKYIFWRFCWPQLQKCTSQGAAGHLLLKVPKLVLQEGDLVAVLREGDAFLAVILAKHVGPNLLQPSENDVLKLNVRKVLFMAWVALEFWKFLRFSRLRNYDCFHIVSPSFNFLFRKRTATIL